jgi:hypothetical protein
VGKTTTRKTEPSHPITTGKGISLQFKSNKEYSTFIANKKYRRHPFNSPHAFFLVRSPEGRNDSSTKINYPRTEIVQTLEKTDAIRIRVVETMAVTGS